MIAAGARVADRFDLLRLETGAPLYRAYAALELGAGREVTLWIPHAGLMVTPEARARFVDAARATRSADGAHLVRVLDAGVDPFLGAQEAAAVAGVGAARGGVWVSVAPSTGQTLAERIARGRPAPDPVVAYLAQSLARAIDAAHASGFVHGYLRAADVMMAGEWPRLSGVGLWTHVDRSAALAALRSDVHLLAPEVRAGEAPGPRADVYAMAVIIAEVALGMAAESSAEAAVLRDRLRRERPNLEAALRAAFSAAPIERPATATQLAAELAGLAPPARTGRSTGAEVRIGGQVVTPVVGNALPYSPLEAPTMPTPMPVPSLTRRSPAPASSITAAILSASELDDAEKAFDDLTGEFETRPRDLLTPQPAAVPLPMPVQESRQILRSTGQVPALRTANTVPQPFARASGEMPSTAVPPPRRTPPPMQVPPSSRRSAELAAVSPPPEARPVARGTQPPPTESATSPVATLPTPRAAPGLPGAHGSSSGGGSGSSLPTPAPVVLSPHEQPLMLINVRPDSAHPATYESLSIEDDPPTAQVSIDLPRAPTPRPGSLDDDAAIATAEFDADAATAARAIASVPMDAVPRQTIDPERTPPGGLSQATALPLPAPEITEIRRVPLMPESPDDPDAPLVIAATHTTPRRYDTAQIAVGDAFAERALQANQKKLKLLGLAVALVAGAAGLVFWWQHASRPGPPVPVHAAAPAPRPLVPPRPTAPIAAAAPVPSGPCKPGMILVEGKERFCIDIDEAAGPDRMPRAGVTQAQAAAACGSAGKRLCYGREWELACRGPNRASYPWGGKPSSSNMYCNLGPGHAIERVGAFDKCVSASGAHDMSGNVAEWVAEGQLRGGSALVAGDGRCSRPLKLTDDRPLDDAGYRCCADPSATP